MQNDRLGKMVGLNLLMLLFCLAAFFFPETVAYILAIGPTLYMVFLRSFDQLIRASYANALGEKYIDSQLPGTPVGMGLRPKKRIDCSIFGRGQGAG